MTMTRTIRKKGTRRKRMNDLLCVVGFAAMILFAASLAAQGTQPSETVKDLSVHTNAADKAHVETASLETGYFAEQTPAPTDPPAVSEEPAPPEPDEAEVEMLACVIYQEAGGNRCSDKCRYMVGDVVLNRIADYRFPDTMEAVLTQERQFGRFYWTGIVWPDRASNPGEAAAVQRAYDTARAILSGEHSEIYGDGYVWQAEFEQCTDIIYLDGMYFGR